MLAHHLATFYFLRARTRSWRSSPCAPAQQRLLVDEPNRLLLRSRRRHLLLTGATTSDSHFEDSAVAATPYLHDRRSLSWPRASAIPRLSRARAESFNNAISSFERRASRLGRPGSPPDRLVVASCVKLHQGARSSPEPAWRGAGHPQALRSFGAAPPPSTHRSRNPLADPKRQSASRLRQRPRPLVIKGRSSPNPPPPPVIGSAASPPVSAKPAMPAPGRHRRGGDTFGWGAGTRIRVSSRRGAMSDAVCRSSCTAQAASGTGATTRRPRPPTAPPLRAQLLTPQCRILCALDGNHHREPPPSAAPSTRMRCARLGCIRSLEQTASRNILSAPTAPLAAHRDPLDIDRDLGRRAGSCAARARCCWGCS